MKRLRVPIDRHADGQLTSAAEDCACGAVPPPMLLAHADGDRVMRFLLRCVSPLLALTAIRYGAQNSVAIGGTAEITGLEAAGGSIENDPKETSLHRSNNPHPVTR